MTVKNLNARIALSRMESIFKYITNLRIKNIRVIMSCLRDPKTNEHSFLPLLGITIGEFCCAYVLLMQNRRR